MTSAEFDACPNRKVDVLVAEKVMGHRVCYSKGEPWIAYMKPAIPGVTHEKPGIVDCPHYSADLNACHGMLQRFFKDENSSKHYDIVFHLTRIIGCPIFESKEMTTWRCLNATAREKCKAALVAMGVIA